LTWSASTLPASLTWSDCKFWTRMKFKYG
jgi:hypothetical protein